MVGRENGDATNKIFWMCKTVLILFLTNYRTPSPLILDQNYINTKNRKVDRNENYDKFMEKMGVNAVKRKLATHDNLKLIISQEGNKFTVKESSTFRNTEIVFELGVTFTYSLADGTELSGTWSLEGDKLVGRFKRVDNGNELHAVREIVGGEMVQTYVYEGVEAKRIFKKQ